MTFLRNWIRRRLRTLLLPFSRDEPDLHVELGFIHTVASVRNFRFDVSQLKQLLDGSIFQFEKFTVDHLVVHLSGWSSPAIKIELHGVNVILSPRTDEGSSRRKLVSSDTVANDIKKVLSSMDPEGCILHDILEKMLGRSTSQITKLKTSFSNLILRHFGVQIHGINVQVCFPGSSDLSCVLEINELRSDSENFGNLSLIRSSAAAVLFPLRRSSLTLSCYGFKIGYKSYNDRVQLCAFDNLVMLITLHNLQLINLIIRIPELSFSFGPTDLPFIMGLANLSSKDSNFVRNGRHLWKVAARKTGLMISPHTFSFQNLVSVVVLWIRYVNAYEYLLSLAGYSRIVPEKSSLWKFSENKRHFLTARRKWEMIRNIEKDLPAEAIARARRVARYRTCLNSQNANDNCEESSVCRHFKSLCKFTWILAYIMRLISSTFWSIACFLSLKNLFTQEQQTDRSSEDDSEGVSLKFHTVVNVGRLSITFCPEKKISSFMASKDSTRHMDSNIVMLCLLVDEFLLMYTVGCLTQCLSASCGKLQVESSCFENTRRYMKSVKDPSSSSERDKKHVSEDVKTILHTNPAQPILLSKTVNNHGNAQHEGILHLEILLREMWLKWNSSCLELDKSTFAISDNPCLHFDIISCIAYQNVGNQDSGIWKCSMVLGKLDIVLDYSSLFSMALLIKQTEWAHKLFVDETGGVQPNSFVTSELGPEMASYDEYGIYRHNVELYLHRFHPERHIQVGIFIGGPQVKLLVEKAEVDSLSREKDLLLFDFHDLEFAVWPIPKSEVVPLKVFQGPDNTRTDRPLLQELGLSDDVIPNYEKYVSQGWNSLSSYLGFSGFDCSFCKMADKKWSQVLVLRPITICFSSARQNVYSFSEAMMDFSTGLDVVVLGLTMVSNPDDLDAYFQMLSSLVSGLSHGLSDLNSGDHSLGRDFPGSDAVIVEQRIKNCCKTLFVVKASIKLNDIDVIFDVPATDIKFEKPMQLGQSRIWSSVQGASIEIACEEHKCLINVDLCEFQSTLFRYEGNIWKSSGKFITESLMFRSCDILFEACLSSCVLSVSMDCSSPSTLGETCGMAGDSASCAGDASIANEPYTNRVQVQREVNKLDSASDSLTSNSTRWIQIDLALTDLLVARGSTKNVLVEVRRSSKFVTSISIGRKFQLISCSVQGGLFVLEPKALKGLIDGYSTYFFFISSKVSVMQSSAPVLEKFQTDSGISEINNHTQQENWYPVKAFSMDVTQFALGFVCDDEYGAIRQIVLEITLHSSLDLAGGKQKFRFEVSRLSVLSKIFENVERDINIIQFSSPASSESSSFLSRAPLETSFQQSDVISSGDSTSVSGDLSSSIEFSANSNLHEAFHSSYRTYILEDLRISASVKKLENTGHQFSQGWVGGCSVLGLDITISLSELQMVLSMLSSFATLPGGESTHASLERPSFNIEPERNFESVVHDGAIVSIQDVNQHMFFTVEARGDKFVATGTLHYSLVGERALFRVNYHRHQGWNSSTLWFSLTSLYAKNNKGEPLRLNYHSSSDLVNISGLHDNAPSLFRASLGKSENYKGDIDWETYRKLVKDTFYLINKKSNSAVAFVDGFPEFVRKPGNPFKFKVFRESLVTSNIVPMVPSEINEVEMQSVMESSPPSVTVTIDGVSLTIVHELSETRDKFPLFRGSVNISQLTAQLLSSKFRIISTSDISLLYFDAQTNQWRELIHPVEVSAFYRSTFQTRDLKNAMQQVPTHIYCRIGKLEVFLTELSLDIVLFVLGKLEFAGPFSVKTSAILSNCCKIENLSGLDLICRFNEKQSATVGRNQTASIFLRHSMNHQEASPAAAVQLSSGRFITSSINVSLLETRTLAWRTRIISLQDSRSHPGPFVVVDIKKELEGGLSISVSPLTRIHNETSLPMEIRFQRSKQKRDDFASVTLKPGGSIDDSIAAFNAVSLSGDLKKALTSLAVGNFSLSFRPESLETLFEGEKSLASEWSEELEGGKAVRLKGIFDKLSYGVKQALSIKSVKVSLTTAHCCVTSERQCVGKVHFLIHSIRREVSIIRPDASSDVLEKQKAIALREQKEIFLLPTVQVSNFLSSDTAIFLTETDQFTSMERHSIGKHAIVQSGKTMDFYTNPDMIYFRVTLTTSQASCKPVNSGQWVKKLQKQKNDVQCLDVDLDFSGGKYCASLRLSLGKRGILEAAVFTSYILKNDSDCPLFFFPPNQKPLSREDMEKFDHIVPPEFGLYLPPRTEGSWFIRSRKVCVILADGDGATEVLLDLDALSGLTEINLGTKDESGLRYITRFGLSVKSISGKMLVPSRIVTFVPRHRVINESEETINIRQRYFQDDCVGVITIKSKQRAALRWQEETTEKKELHLFENFIRKHGSDNANPLIFIQFRLNKADWSWSGPLCISSIGCFFLKFRKLSSEAGRGAIEFASVTVTEEGSILDLHFQKPPNTLLPYRIENFLHSASLSYYQKDSSEMEVLGPGSVADYAWDDMTLPHKLVVIIDGMLPLREVSLDKVRPWKPLFKATQHRSIASHLMLNKKTKEHKTNDEQFSSIPMVKIGYEVYADGMTRVIRICEVSESLKGDLVYHSRSKIQFRVTHLGIHLLEKAKENTEEKTVVSYSPILVARLDNIGLQSMFTDQQNFNRLCVEALNVDHKWAGAPFAAMLRQHQSNSSDTNDCLFKCAFVLASSSSSVTQVKHSSIVLQPVNLNLDEETLMRLVAFWRSSLSTNTQSSQYYFDHFEIHPIKITANFVPGSSYSSYNSAQETLRSLLHSVVKVPHIKNMVVELNGVLVTHALITVRELLLRCVKHYSWYAMRAIYIAKGSPLLPPAFASMFDDFSSSSLDAFFDPSRGLVDVPGLTVGTFKLLSKLIDKKGLSGTRRYFGDLGKTLRTAGSNVIFVALTEISDSVLRGAEMKGVDGLVSGFHHGILKLAMEPSVIGTALMEGGPDRTIKLDRNPGIDELYIEGYIQAMLDTMYRQEYLRVKVIDDQVFLRNLPPSNSLIDEMIDRVKEFLESRGLLKGDPSSSRPRRRLHGDKEWKIGPTVRTLFEHIFVSFAIRILRQHATKAIKGLRPKKEEAEAESSSESGEKKEMEEAAIVISGENKKKKKKMKFMWKAGIGNFVASGIVAYIDGRLCRQIPNPIARRIVSGFLLSFLEKTNEE